MGPFSIFRKRVKKLLRKASKRDFLLARPRGLEETAVASSRDSFAGTKRSLEEVTVVTSRLLYKYIWAHNSTRPLWGLLSRAPPRDFGGRGLEAWESSLGGDSQASREPKTWGQLVLGPQTDPQFLGSWAGFAKFLHFAKINFCW